MATSSSTTTFKADISQLKSQMSAAARQVKLANSEFKAASAGMKDWASSADGLEAKVKQLSTVLKAQKEQVKLATEEWEKTKKQYGENSVEADKVEIRLNNLKAAMGKTEKELETYEQDLSDCKEGTGKFANELDASESEMKDAEKAVKDLDDGFTTMKGVMADLVASGIKAVISGFKDMISTAAEAYQEFDEGQDIMIAKTGATGEALEALKDNYVDVANTIVADSDQIGSAIGQVSTKFGVQGEELTNLSTKFLEFSKLNNTDVSTSIENVQKAMTAWGLSADEADNFLDLLNATGQKTGASVDALSNSLTSNAAALKDMGFNVDEATTFLGNLELAGVDSSTVMAGLKKALTNAAQEGKTTKDALAELQDAMSSADSETEKTVAAMELFGNKGGPAIAEACSSGRLNFEDLGKAMTDYEGNLDNTYDATLDASDKIKLTFQGMKAEVGRSISEMLEDSEPEIEELMDFIKENFKIILDKVKKNAPQIKETVIGIIKAITKVIIGLIENFDAIVTIVKAVGTVLLATFAVTKIASFISTIVGLVKTFQTLKAATDAATTSQQLLNVAQNANVIGAITAAVAGLAAAFIWLISEEDEEKEKLETLNEWESKQVEKIHEMSDAYRQMDETRKESMAAVESEYAHYEELADELGTIVDKNGQVKEGYEDRASFIITTLNDALGTEMELVDGIVQGYEGEIDAIYDLIDAKKAEAILSANEEAYTEALKNRTEAVNNLVTAEGIYKQNYAEKIDLERKLKAVSEMTDEEYATRNGIVGNAAEMEAAHQKALGELQEQLNATNGAVGESRTAYEQAKASYEGYESTIKNYEGLSSAIISGDADKIDEAMLRMTNSFLTHETASEESLKKQYETLKTEYDNMVNAIDAGTIKMDKETVDGMKKLVDDAKVELDKAGTAWPEAGSAAMRNYTGTLGSDENKQAAKSATAGVRDEAYQGLLPDGKEKDAGNNFTLGYISGMEINANGALTRAKELGSGAVNSLNEGQESQSPSQATRRSGENFGQGFINGMNNKTNSIWDTAWNLAKKALEALKKSQQEGSPSKLTRQSGEYFGQGYELGILETSKSVIAAATKIAIDAATGLDDKNNGRQSGVDLVANFIDGIESMSGKADYAISGIGKGSFVNGMKNVVNTAKIEIDKAMTSSGYTLMASMNGMSSIPSSAVSTPGGYGTNIIQNTNNYNLNQVNNSPKSLSALDSFRYRRQQIEMVKTISRG